MAEHRPCTLVFGANDTKAREIKFLCQCLDEIGINTLLVDLDLHVHYRDSDGSGDAKLKAMQKMAQTAYAESLSHIEAKDIDGIIAMGGGVGTWIATEVMHRLPFGLPKIILSTLPSDPRPLVKHSDIILVPTIVDLLGLNPILRTVIRNAAAALAGMIEHGGQPEAIGNRLIGLTGLGETSSSVFAACEFLEKAGHEVATFHVNGIGGNTFETLIGDDAFAGILDLTTTELTNHLFGGLADPGPHRLEAAAAKGVPQVVVPGGLGFVTRGPIEGISEEERGRKHYAQNMLFTHVRLNKNEMRQVAETVAEKLNKCVGPVAVAIPKLGFSRKDGPGGIIDDPKANAAFTATLRERLRSDIPIQEKNAHIADPAFIQFACRLLLDLMENPTPAEEPK